LSSVVVRTLSRELHLRTNSPDVHAALMCLNTEPRLPGRDLTPIVLDVEEAGSFFRLCLPGLQPAEGSLETIATAVHRQIGIWWVEEFGHLPILHAGTAAIDGRRIAFIGDGRAGKTTLMLRLIQEGFAVQGDEYLLITANGAISSPRCLHVKETSLEMLPDLADRIRSLPFLTDWVGNITYACPPSFTGVEWTIAEEPVDELIFLEPNFGGSSVLSRFAREHAFLRMMQSLFIPTAGRARAVARLRKLALDCHCWRLQTGNLDQAIDRLRRLVSKGYG